MNAGGIQEQNSPDSLIQPAWSASKLPAWLLNDKDG